MSSKKWKKIGLQTPILWDILGFATETSSFCRKMALFTAEAEFSSANRQE
jgi:hypothetical protein